MKSDHRAERAGSVAGAAPVLEQAIARLTTLKQEHGPLLATIAADPGMEPATREKLIAHLYEEEDEALARIRAAASARAAPSGAAAPSTRLSVGSLRVDPAPPPGASPSIRVGSLRGA
jgi:hypothetical protein